MTLNGDNSEIEVVVEIKIKLIPSSQMRGIINRLLPNQEEDDTAESKPQQIDEAWIRRRFQKTQPAGGHKKPDTPPVEPQHVVVRGGAGDSSDLSAEQKQKLQQDGVCGTSGGSISHPPLEVETAKSPTTAAETAPITGIPWPDIGDATDPQPLRGIGKIDTDDYIQGPIHVTGFKNLAYSETKDKRLTIMYGSARVNTTWADIHTICGCKFKQETKDAIERLVGPGRAKNKYTAVSRFVKAVSHDVISPYKADIPKDDDPDAAFKPILSGVVDTHVGNDEKVEGTLD